MLHGNFRKHGVQGMADSQKQKWTDIISGGVDGYLGHTVGNSFIFKSMFIGVILANF